jgi:hypothetical protein
VPIGSEDVVIASAGITVMLRLAVAVAGVLSESSTFTTKSAVPETVAVPEITPVEGVSDNPAGRVPELMLHL